MLLTFEGNDKTHRMSSNEVVTQRTQGPEGAWMVKPGTKWPPKKVFGGGMVRMLIQNGWTVKEDPWNLLKQDYGQNQSGSLGTEETSLRSRVLPDAIGEASQRHQPTNPGQRAEVTTNGQGAAQPELQTNGNGVSVPEHATDTAQPPTVEKKKRPRINDLPSPRRKP